MNVRLNKKLNASQRKILKAECVKEFDKLLADYNRQVAVQVLYILHFDFGYGQERLRRFSEKMKEMQITTIDRYESKEDDVPYICEIKLRDSGINVDEFLKEGQQNG